MIELTELSLTPFEGREWKLLKDWKVVVRKEVLTIPKGFVTDLASVPRIFWIIIPPSSNKCRKASIVHDWMYVHQHKTKSYADSIFLSELLSKRLFWLQAHIMYWAVKLFGKGNYN